MPDVGATDYVWMETKIVDVSRGLSHVYIYRRTCTLPGPSPRAIRFEAVNPDLISINDRYLVNGNLYAIFTTALRIRDAHGGKCTLRMAGILKENRY